jgi:predicted  nucleic acid-binding Zn-ribbon protein
MTPTEKQYVEKLEELDKKQWDLIQTDDSRYIVQSALHSYDGSDEYSPEYRKLAVKEDNLYYKSEKLRRYISKLKSQLASLKQQIEAEPKQLREIIKSCVEDVWYSRRSLNPIKDQTDLLMERLVPILESTYEAKLKEELLQYKIWENIFGSEYNTVETLIEGYFDYLKQRNNG